MFVLREYRYLGVPRCMRDLFKCACFFLFEFFSSSMNTIMQYTDNYNVIALKTQREAAT